MMKTDIEIVTGFIGSGKTTFINALLEHTLGKEEKVLIIQLESGAGDIEEKFIKNKNVRYKPMSYEEFSERRFNDILQKITPHRVIIEFNGTEDINKLLELIHSKRIKELSNLTTTYFVSEAKTFIPYLNNMGRFLLPCLQISDLVILNNTKGSNKDSLNSVTQTIKEYKDFIPILEVEHISNIKETLNRSKLFHRGILKTWDIFLKNLRA